MYPSFEDFLHREERTQYVENPEKMANYERCMALARELHEDWGLPLLIQPVPGGADITLRLYCSVYTPSCNALLGELIGRCGAFCPMPDRTDPCYITFLLTAYSHDRVLDGRVLPD